MTQSEFAVILCVSNLLTKQDAVSSKLTFSLIKKKKTPSRHLAELV